MVNFTKELITPARAKEYLEANIGNRRVKHPVVMRYAEDMASGRWKQDTAEVIKIAKSGRLLDGQQRLLAIVKANVPIWFHVAKDLDDNVFDVLDTGSLRNATDVFKIKGIKHENTIPSIIQMYNIIKGNKSYGTQKNNRSTNAVLLDQYYDDENFWQNVAKQSHKWYLAYAKIITPSFIGGFYAYFSKLDENMGYSFLNQLATGQDISNNTITLLRNKLMQDKMSVKKMPQNIKMALMIKTWNNFVLNKEISVLKFDPVRDEYPKPLKPIFKK